MKLKNQYRISVFVLISNLILFSASSGQEKPPEIPDGYSSNFTLKIAYFLGTLDLVETKFPVPDSIKEYKDIVYKTVDTTELKLDIYHLKKTKEPAPLLVFIHGGAWKKGKKHDYLRYLVDFAERGYITATVQYRLSKEAKYPAQILDVKTAIKWLIEHSSQYFIDSLNLALIGGSAGGHLAMMAGYTSNVPSLSVEGDSLIYESVKAIVDIYGPSDLTTEYAIEQSSVNYLIGEAFEEAPEIYEEASPIMHISSDDPPTLIFQGTLDELVPVIQSDRLNEKLKNTGVPVEYHRLEGWPHTMDLAVEVNEYFQYYMNRFFEKYLKMESK